MVHIVVRDRKNTEKLIAEFDLDAKSDTILDLKKQVHRIKGSRLAVERQRITLLDDDSKKALSNETVIRDCMKNGAAKEIVVCVKDLGPQIGWKTVFLVEYAGPILVHSLVYLVRSIFYESTLGPIPGIAKLCYALVVFHYLKRELETVFVHRFSNDTMPFTNLFKNCFHYYVLGGVLIAYPTYFVSNSSSSSSDNWVFFWTAIFFYAEISNLYTHVTLSNLRPPGTRARKIPTGYGFSLVSCANYMFEVLAWISFSMIAGNWLSWLFTLVSGVQMALWAMKKHKAYLKEFPDYPKGRKAMIPFLY